TRSSTASACATPSASCGAAATSTCSTASTRTSSTTSSRTPTSSSTWPTGRRRSQSCASWPPRCGGSPVTQGTTRCSRPSTACSASPPWVQGRRSIRREATAMNGTDTRPENGGLAAYRPDFGLPGKVCVVTGATGVLGSVMARGIAAAGARVAVLGRRADVAEALAAEIRAAGGEARATPADVVDKAALTRVRDELLRDWGSVDMLVNAAGGNQPGATLRPDQSVLELDETAMRQVMELNFFGTLLPTQV